ncbi:hypothetical protein BX070DRAFT_222936 [Coemansia spiralis]|nr:hypothetical protein BX070DRAFT_222936 [Coemansia spiralis]
MFPKLFWTILALACLLHPTNAQTTTMTSTEKTRRSVAAGIQSSISVYPDGVLVIDSQQTSCMVALINENYGFVAANCLAAGGTSSIPISRLKIVINGLQSSGLISVSAATIHPSYNSTTLANNIAVLGFDLTGRQTTGSSNSQGNTRTAYSALSAQNMCLVRRTLTNVSSPQWNPVQIVGVSSITEDVCRIGSPIYAANTNDFICNHQVAPVGNGLAPCSLPLGLAYTEITPNSAMPSAIFSHSVVFGDGLCSKNKKAHYYILLNNYLAWGAATIQDDNADDKTGRSAQKGAGYSMAPAANIVPVIQTYGGNLYTQTSAPAPTSTTLTYSSDSGANTGCSTSSSMTQYVTYITTSTSCDPVPSTGATNIPTNGNGSGSGNGSDGDSNLSNCDNSDDSDDSDDDSDDDPFSGITNISIIQTSDYTAVVTRGSSGNPFSGIINISTISTTGNSGDSDADTGSDAGSTSTGTAASNDTGISENDSTTELGGSSFDLDMSDGTGDLDSSVSPTNSAEASNVAKSSGGISRTTAILIAVLVPLSVLIVIVCLYFYYKRKTQI